METKLILIEGILGSGKSTIAKKIGQYLESRNIRTALFCDRDIYLQTQTWSYKAIGIYMRAGFEILETGTFGGYKNDYEKAMSVLMGKIKG